jgi:hypothetical protein
MNSKVEFDLTKRYYIRVLSASKIEKLIRALILKGFNEKDITLYCSADLLTKVKLYCAFNIKAQTDCYQGNMWHGRHKVVLATMNIPELRIGRYQILINLDDKETDLNGYSEVYNTYTDKKKQSDKIPYFKGLPNRDWKKLLTASPLYGVENNYLLLHERNAFKYFMELYPEKKNEDNLFLPKWGFTKWNNENNKLYSAILLINRLLSRKFASIELGEHLDFITTKDGREFNALITLKKQYRETLIYQALNEQFTDYTFFDVDFNSCFPTIILRCTGVIDRDSAINFKLLTEEGKLITPDMVFKNLGYGSKDTRDNFKKAYEEGGSPALAKVVLNSVFNGYGATKIKNTAQRIEYVLRWLVAYEWDSCDFNKLDNLGWLEKESYFLCAKAEKELRDKLIKKIKWEFERPFHGRSCAQHDGIGVFCPKEQSDKLKDVLKEGVLRIEEDIDVTWNEYRITIPLGSVFPFKVKTDLPNKLKREEFISALGLVDGSKFEYTEKGKFRGKAKNKAVGRAKNLAIYLLEGGKSKKFITDAKLKELSTYNEPCKFAAKMNLKKMLLKFMRNSPYIYQVTINKGTNFKIKKY